MNTTLVLNASYEPLHVVSWQRAITLTFLGKVEVVHTYEREVRSVSLVVKVPAVVRLLSYIRLSGRRTPPLNRLNLMARDGFRCQYCDVSLSRRESTIDHVIPRSQGGETTWENVVLACHGCNRKKGGRTPKQARMKLLRQPRAPNWLPVVSIQVSPSVPSSWLAFISKHHKMR